jgi:ectoine hydroxylase-related dioxygenase (phytanoyl-CoA dioxygenase family)
MLHEYANAPWQELKDKGYVHIKKFLTDAELLVLRDDWTERSKATKGSANGNYPIVDVTQRTIWRFHRKVKAVTDTVSAVTGINADADAGGSAYFATTKGVNFCWHQDHEPFFVYQQSIDYLNFYIPVLKPDIKRTNLCLIPMDSLQARLPEHFERLLGSGAKRYYPNGNETLVCDDEDGSEYTLPMNFEDFKVTPELEPGDLLLLRGDVIHRTEDTETERVAVSFRRTSSRAVINRAKILSGCSKKHEMMRNNWDLYKVVFECLDKLNQDEITAHQFHAYFMSESLQRSD